MLNNISTLLTVLIALSVASERLVAIVQNVVPWLRSKQPATEFARKVVLQLLAVGAGIATAWLAEEVLPPTMQGRQHLVVLGLLASGGSGFWTSVLGYVSSVKDIKQVQAVATRVRAAATVAAIANGTAAHPAAAAAHLRTTVVAPTQPLAGAAAATKNLEDAIELANNVL